MNEIDEIYELLVQEVLVAIWYPGERDYRYMPYDYCTNEEVAIAPPPALWRGWILRKMHADTIKSVAHLN